MSEKFRYLLISPDGMLGRAWQELLERQGCAWRSVTYPQFDLTDPASIKAAATDDLDVVINCAAWTDVDGAEEREADADAVNGLGAGALAQRCCEIDALLVHYSTDYVFDGQANEPYRVDQATDPINAYGRTKLHGEQAISASGCEHLILRTSWLYAPWAKNFVMTMAKLTAEKEQLRVVDDQRGRPTSAQHLASVSLALIQSNARGILHVTDGGECSWYELTRHINEHLGHTCNVLPCTTDEFPRPAKRPAYSVLDLEPTEAIVGPMPAWQDNVSAVLDQLAGEPDD